MLGRFVWSSTSDLVGRKNIYRLYLGVGALLYLVIALTTNSSKLVFILCAMVILSFYGGGFATVPAYLKDMFGTFQVGAIHGRLLTAWSVAGVLGPLIVNAIADSQKRAGNSGPDLYTTSFYIMIGLLVIGFVANELVRPVNPKYHEPARRSRRGVRRDERTAGDRRVQPGPAARAGVGVGGAPVRLRHVPAVPEAGQLFG